MDRRRVLLVIDDDDSVLKSIARLLRAMDLNVIVFAKIKEFFRLESYSGIDCFLVDIHLDGMSGIELKRQLAGWGVAAPVIFMTADDTDAVREEALAAGCAAYLKKPFQADMLIGAVEKALAGS
jgi:FixJ family two-component response regulator